MTHEHSLPELLDVIRWRWKLILGVAILVASGASLYVETLPSQYDGAAVVAFAPRASAPSASADTVRVVVPKYAAYVTADATIRRVATQLRIDPGSLRRAVTAQLASLTGNVTITVRLKEPGRAARAANSFALAAVEYSRKDPLLVGELVAAAAPPSSPSSPPRRILEAAALLVGLLIGLAAAAVLERGRPRLRDWRQMTELTGQPVVGRIPRSRLVSSRFHSHEGFWDPSIASAFRTLRANIEPQLQEKEIDVLAVTSPLRSDGKTTIAALLAEALSRRDLQVLLIDADLRRAKLSQSLDSSSQGLAGILRGAASIETEVQPGWARNLSVLPTTRADDAGDLLARGFDKVLEKLQGELFDLVVVDCPPLLGLEDTRSIAPHADGVLLVVTVGSDTEPVNEAVLTLEALRAPLLGIVANRVRDVGVLYSDLRPSDLEMSPSPAVPPASRWATGR